MSKGEDFFALCVVIYDDCTCTSSMALASASTADWKVAVLLTQGSQRARGEVSWSWMPLQRSPPLLRELVDERGETPRAHSNSYL